MVFPYYEGGKIVAEKYRWGGKQFAQKKGGKKTFFNSDCIDDEALRDGSGSLVIVEGEMDCLSLLEAGHPWAVSVPDGAPPGRDAEGNVIPVPEGTEDIDIANDGKFAYILNNWERLKDVKSIIIASDDDDAGRRLSAELVRRLGRIRCSHVRYPELAVVPDGDAKRPCKDMNEVLVHFGAQRVLEVIKTAKPYPVSGIYLLSEFPKEPELTFVSTGFKCLDEHVKLYHPSFVVVTGKAGSGKSTFTMQMAAQVCDMQAWRMAIASFEMRVRPYVTDGLGAAILRKPKYTWSPQDRQEMDAWIERQVVFIAPDPEDSVTHDIPWLISRMQAAVIRHGVRLIVLDPWNEIEHTPNRNESLTEYVGRAIRMLKQFAQQFDVCLIVVAHPTKSGAQKPGEEITLYDVSDSAHFANKPDIGIVVHRKQEGGRWLPMSTIKVDKVRYQPDAGVPGAVDMRFDERMRTFVEFEASKVIIPASRPF
jgi:twinkle protein